MSFRRMLPFLLLNILVSAATVLAILFWWDSRRPQEAAYVLPTLPPVETQLALSVPDDPTATVPVDAPVEDEQLTYTVAAGDTLGAIAQEFDTPMDDIMAVNGISDPNNLSVGQVLVIPVGGIPTATPPPTAEPTADVAPSPIPTQVETEGEVDIRITDVIGAGVLTEEAIVIANLGTRSVALEGWRVVDPGGREYRFGQRTLFGDGAGITLHTEAGVDTLTDAFWGLEEAIWAPGAQVTLLDAEGTVQATFVVP